MMEDRQLLSRYVEDASEAAFRELVARHVDLVYSVALREVRGDEHLAHDVAQVVFIDLARKARSLRHDVVLAGWLHRATCYAARQTLRAQRRRQAREEQAIAMNTTHSDSQADWEQVAPEIDRALDRLNRTDRDALVLRYFSQSSFAAIGAALGSNEDTARKRVTRALAKLRSLLERRGVTTSATALSALLAANAVQAAPVGLTAALASASLAASASAGGVALTFLELMTMTKLKAGLVSALIVAGVATPLVLQPHQSAARLREENNALRSQLQALAAQPTAAATPAGADQSLDNEQHRELLRLRGEVGQLRKQTNELDRLRNENRKLRASTAPLPNVPAAETATLDFPREAWEFVGYAEPAGAFQSMIWSLSNGRVPTALGSFTPDQREKMIAKHKGESRSEEVIAAEMVRDMQYTKRFRVLEQEVIAEDEVQLRILVEGEKTPDTVIDRRARMRKIDGEWKFDGWARKPGREG
jgi:RNA polymerase sigma factor (sigma-70 family)